MHFNFNILNFYYNIVARVTNTRAHTHTHTRFSLAKKDKTLESEHNFIK